MTEPSTKDFKAVELRCKCAECDRQVPNECDPYALRMLQTLRTRVGVPLVLNSAYRCANHPDEAKKEKPGTHHKGVAFDIRVPYGRLRMRIIEEALKLGAKGFGFGKTFLHIDFRMQNEATSWDYN
ncbi:D-Ala-D-Ala carboxypeptidase family metallohydrolase [Pseudoalteromonas sp. CH_XMU1449-3]|uniref:D-Ala-D-Ala carboxypeptidase family metallohydrolase n=1 Tax=Pseudoalteromonas sp. CH_XMU1449-3 TaxID=3107774 RepID=UPI00300BC47E